MESQKKSFGVFKNLYCEIHAFTWSVGPGCTCSLEVSSFCQKGPQPHFDQKEVLKRRAPAGTAKQSLDHSSDVAHPLQIVFIIVP